MSSYKAKPKDGHGLRKGTKAARVAAAVTSKWQTVEEIAKKAHLKRADVLVKLHAGRNNGLYEYERIIKFKLKKK
jgi:hypothetical protein